MLSFHPTIPTAGELKLAWRETTHDETTGEFLTTESTDRAAALPSPAAAWQSPSPGVQWRSEEHTSELQSRFDLVCRLLLEKKKKGHAQDTKAGRKQEQVMD